MGSSQTEPTVLVRRLNPGGAGSFAWLDAVAEAPPSQTFRIFGRAGMQVPEGLSAHFAVAELRDISGGSMLVCENTRAHDGGFILPDNAEAQRYPLTPPEWGLLAGRDVILGFRALESTATVLDWLAYHRRHHAITGALIINRADDAGQFASALARALAGQDWPDLTVLVLEPGQPLGKPDQIAETHPFMAPDAPGKDRMVVPPPDPWLAPLGEHLIFECVKWRFLAEARVVLTLDCCDFLPPLDGPGVFERCLAAESGALFLAGRRAYPWRIRADQAAAFGDHICRQFDSQQGIARWAVAPRKVGLSNSWRIARVSYTRPDHAAVIPFWRAMALKVPGQKPSVLAPKTSLVEDADLLALARTHFAANPVRPPKSVARAKPKAAHRAGGTCIVTTMKNEGAFILDWLAYHRAIGVEDVLVYSNDCDDGTDRLLDLLAERGHVQHRANPYEAMPGLKPQHAALQAAEGEECVRQADWIICMDVDEYINIKIGDGTLAALYQALGEANMISLTWRLFGNADVARYEDRPVFEQFRLAAPELVRKPHQAWGFKTLFRNIDMYKKLGVHRPKGLRADLWKDITWLNGSGKRMPRAMLRNGWRSSASSYGYDWVQLNHYACRSAESFLVKRDRGRVNHVERDQGVNYWFRMNHNAEEENSILRMGRAFAAEKARLLADPVIQQAHMDCVAAHRERIAALHREPEFAELYRELTSARLRSLSRMLRHFGASVFNAGPAVIPADLHLTPMAEDFFFSVDHVGDAQH
ncbi:MAG: glycosyltransferase family 2 protein [Paracoccaceae bacterium]